MKLYTEEHLKIFYHLGKIDGFIGRQDDVALGRVKIQMGLK